MKDKVESGFGMNDEKKYFYALNENRFKFGLYRTSISELKRAYPKLKAGDTMKTLYVHGMSEMDKQIFEEDGEICVADDGGQNVIFIYDPYTKKLIGMLDMSYSATCLIKKEKLYE